MGLKISNMVKGREWKVKPRNSATQLVVFSRLDISRIGRLCPSARARAAVLGGLSL